MTPVRGFALKRVFGDEMPQVSSTKGLTGHTTSASGSVEAVICLLAMRHDLIPVNYGWAHQIEGGLRQLLIPRPSGRWTT